MACEREVILKVLVKLEGPGQSTDQSLASSREKP